MKRERNLQMKNCRTFHLVAMLALSAPVACSYETAGSPEVTATFTFESSGLPVGFDRQAGVITFGEGTTSFDTVDTRYPVLRFTGANSDRTMIAYTSLALPDREHDGGFVDVDLAGSMVVALMDLVPTGRLVLERPDGSTTTIVREDSYIVAAAWHPTDPNLIGFSYMEGDHYGLSIYDVRTDSHEDVLQDDLTPELIVWSDDGSSLGAYMADPTLPRREIPTDHEGVYDIAHRWQHIVVPTIDRGSLIEQPTFDRGSMNFVEASSLSEIAFERGGLLTLPEGLSGDAVLFERAMDDNGTELAIELRADQIRHLSRHGLAFVNFDEGGMHLFASDGSEMPGLIRTISAVTYYIPLHSTEDSYLTQVGSGYGGGCSVMNHTGNLAYAVDIQIPTSGYDEVIASANGTISGGASWVTCNSLDTSGCAIYSSPCSSNGGWGNYVMIAHSDGRYTLYAHLESTNYQVTMSGVSVSRGCWLADEGGTGASSGNKNGCGDHVHFQWQNSGSLGSASVSGGFSEVTLGTGSCGWRATSTAAMSCSL